MRRNKFYLLTTPVLFVAVLPVIIAWYGLKELPELLRECRAMPRELRKAWAISSWF